MEAVRVLRADARPFAKMTIASRAKPAQLAKEESAQLVAVGLAARAFD